MFAKRTMATRSATIIRASGQPPKMASSLPYGLGRGVGRGLGVGVLLGVGVAVGGGVTVEVAVAVAVAVGVALAPTVAVAVAVGVGDAPPQGLTGQWKISIELSGVTPSLA